MAEWNAQAFLASEPGRNEMKRSYLLSLLARSDVLLLTDACGTEGGHLIWRPPTGCSAWWSAGASTAHAGVGIVVQDRFMARFEEPPRWSVVWPGRAAVLSLRGPEGALDIIVAYFPTGSDVNEADLCGAHVADLAEHPSFPELRAHLRSRLARHVLPPVRALTVLGGGTSIMSSRLRIGGPRPRRNALAGGTRARRTTSRMCWVGPSSCTTCTSAR